MIWRQSISTTSSSSPRIAAIEPGCCSAASAIARPRSRTSATASASSTDLRGGERGELPDRVADDEVGLDPLGSERGQDGQARRHERGLLHLGLHELLERRVEAQVDEVEPDASLARSNTLIASGTASAISRPMPGSSDPWPGKQNATFPCPFPSLISLRSSPSIRADPSPM